MSAKNMMLVKGEKTTMSHIYPVLNKITGLMVYRSSGDVQVAQSTEHDDIWGNGFTDGRLLVNVYCAVRLESGWHKGFSRHKTFPPFQA